MQDEHDELLQLRGALQLVPRSTLPADYNILNGCFGLALKGESTEEPPHKAWFVLQRHRDSQKHKRVHNSSTDRPASVRLLV